ncbi:hypothetical protein BX666DRAFT_1870331, partial [Dichotomocladium elegans]
MLDLPFHQLKKIEPEIMISSGLEKKLLMLDEQAVQKRHKVGVVYMKEGQIREEEWLANLHDSERFDRFLNIIGRKVGLNGYMGWAGGLDTKSGDSGEYTYVAEWNDHEIAYHVSSLIPSKPGDKQQIQKKRHIGNDMVCIVYASGKQPFNPAAIKSQFLHIFIVVHEDEWEGQTGWRIEVVAADNVPCFNPPLPENAIFFDENKLRTFLLAKLMSAEYAAYKSPKFAEPMTRARKGILSGIVDIGYKIAKDPDIPHLHHHGHHSSFFSSKSPSTSSDRSSKSTRSISSSELPPIPAPSRSTSSSNSLIAKPSMTTATLGERSKEFPSPNEFEGIIMDYLKNLSAKKRDKALVDAERYDLILQVLKDPRNTSISTAQFRFWVKKMFQLVRVDMRDIVYHDHKPVATREQIYDIVVCAHHEAHHGGRDKTSALVRRRYSWIPKELIARFVRHCPFCITRRNGCSSPIVMPP